MPPAHQQEKECSLSSEVLRSGGRRRKPRMRAPSDERGASIEEKRLKKETERSPADLPAEVLTKAGAGRSEEVMPEPRQQAGRRQMVGWRLPVG